MSTTYCWRRVDFVGLEILQLNKNASGIEARSTIIAAGDDKFALNSIWRLDTQWRSRSLELTQHSGGGERSLRIERRENDWLIDGAVRPDLTECTEIDVSATPFCNGLALHALGREPGELTALYVDAGDLTVRPSRQAYERIGPSRWRYVDLGVAKGFKAVLDFDENGLVTTYEGLFERV